MSKKAFLLLLTVALTYFANLSAQATDAEDVLFIRKMHDKALTELKAYNWLYDICTKIGGRLSGSPQAAKAVDYTKNMLDTLGLDKVWLQPCMVPHWVRGAKESVEAIGSMHAGVYKLNALALGNSVGSGDKGVTGEVIEVKGLDEVEKLGEKVRGKIVFYNRPMDPTKIETFRAYGGAVDQRVGGASAAAKYGAVGMMVRSMNLRLDDYPHTGTLVYKEGVPQIPAVAISTNDAEKLSTLLKREKVKVSIITHCQMLEKAPSNNVIGEIKGTEHPEEIIIVGGHLDSWDPAQGAQDDGAGVVQSMGVLQLLKQMGYKPKRTIRCVLFMNEENGSAGAEEYAKESDRKKEKHIAAIESDAGGFTPRGFSFDGDGDILPAKFDLVTKWANLFEPYGLRLKRGGSGADVGELKAQKPLLIGFEPDSQRYFDYHHTAIDTIDAVNKRELELGTAAMASLVYLMDKYGL